MQVFGMRLVLLSPQLPMDEICWAVPRVNRAANKEMGLLAACADTRSASARSRSTPLTGPSAEQEFFRARHCDVQQPTFFAKIGVGPWKNAILKPGDNRGAHSKPLGTDHRHNADARAFGDGAILSQRGNLHKNRPKP